MFNTKMILLKFEIKIIIYSNKNEQKLKINLYSYLNFVKVPQNYLIYINLKHKIFISLKLQSKIKFKQFFLFQ